MLGRYRITEAGSSVLGDLIAWPIKSWVALLIVGSLGHRLDIPFLLRLDYGDMLLITWLCSILFKRAWPTYKIESK